MLDIEKSINWKKVKVCMSESSLERLFNEETDSLISKHH